jgi:hypothetical protein
MYRSLKDSDLREQNKLKDKMLFRDSPETNQMKVIYSKNKEIKNIVISSVLPPITSAPGFENPNAFGQHTMTNFNLFEQQLETNEEQ